MLKKKAPSAHAYVGLQRRLIMLIENSCVGGQAEF